MTRDVAPPPPSSPGAPGGDGVRVVPLVIVRRGRAWRWVAGLAALAAIAAIGGWALFPAGSAAQARSTGGTADVGTAPAADRGRPERSTPRPAAEGARPTPVDAPDDLAAYFRAGDPEPTGAELIDALNAAGVRTGIGAFNPPGTSPVLAGLAVPDGFPLPPGYVRHHQVTDEGVPLAPILMFAPDFVLRDARGRRIPLPADRVVPPEHAPPGLPLRRVHAQAR